MKKQVDDWISLADRDLKAAEIIVQDDCPLTNIVAFHCQQAIEKYLKAYLIEKDLQLEKTHDLVKLNGTIMQDQDIGLDENKLDTINEVYIESRYPGELGLVPDGIPSERQAYEFIKYVKDVRNIIIGVLGGESTH